LKQKEENSCSGKNIDSQKTQIKKHKAIRLPKYFRQNLLKCEYIRKKNGYEIEYVSDYRTSESSLENP